MAFWPLLTYNSTPHLKMDWNLGWFGLKIFFLKNWTSEQHSANSSYKAYLFSDAFLLIVVTSQGSFTG